MLCGFYVFGVELVPDGLLTLAVDSTYLLVMGFLNSCLLNLVGLSVSLNDVRDQCNLTLSIQDVPYISS